jgi:hypothetical protein
MNLYVSTTILSLTFASISFGQLSKTHVFSVREGWCSTTYIIDSTGKFCRERGCEGRSHISCGTYQLKEDKITFIFNNFDSIPPVLKIVETSKLNDSTIKVIFRTCDNNIIYKDNFIVDAIDTSGRFFKTLPLNDNGEVFVNPKKYKSLRLNYLQNFYGKWMYVDVKTNNMEIVLNFPKEFFYYSDPIVETDKAITLTLKIDGLYDITGKEKVFPLNQ